MAISLGSNHGSLNGATPVTLVAAPGAGVSRTVVSVHLWNADTAAVTVTTRKTVGATDYGIDQATSLPVAAPWTPINRDAVLMLTGTTQSLTAVMSGAAATTNPTFAASWVDKS